MALDLKAVVLFAGLLMRSNKMSIKLGQSVYRSMRDGKVVLRLSWRAWNATIRTCDATVTRFGLRTSGAVQTIGAHHR